MCKVTVERLGMFASAFVCVCVCVCVCPQLPISVAATVLSLGLQGDPTSPS